MTARAKTPPSGASPSRPTLAALARQADERLRALVQQCEAQSQLATATAAHLGRLAASQAQNTGHHYRVFRIEATQQHIVLRDVEQLDGATPVFATTSFAEALQRVNASLVDLVAKPAPPPAPSSAAPPPASAAP